MVREPQQGIKISTQYTRKKVAAKIHSPEIVQLPLLRYFRLSCTSRTPKSGVVWVSCWATMSPSGYIPLCRGQWSYREGNRLYFGPDQRFWENLLLSCCHGMASAWCFLQWGGLWANQAPSVTLLLLWCSAVDTQAKKTRRITQILWSLLCHYFLAVSLISDHNCIYCTIEAKAATVIVHFWIRSPSQEKIYCKHSCPACTGWDCWHPLILSIFCMHNYGS